MLPWLPVLNSPVLWIHLLLTQVPKRENKFLLPYIPLWGFTFTLCILGHSAKDVDLMNRDIYDL